MTAFGQRTAAQSVNAFNCPSCGGPIALRAGGISVNAVCGQCSAIIDAADPNLRVLQAAEANTIFPDIPIGSRGELAGIQWEVIGYVRKAVAGTVYAWEEYLLWSQAIGFRWLMKDPESGWSWVVPANIAEIDLRGVPEPIPVGRAFRHSLRLHMAF